MLIDGEKLLIDLEKSGWSNKVEPSVVLLVVRLIKELMKGCLVDIKSPAEIERAIEWFLDTDVDFWQEIYSITEVVDLLRAILNKKQDTWAKKVFAPKKKEV